ncbi:MAG: VWA domain-containing protein, partial [Erysipelothrix sp.]|nr:VWA domain-containing protein [Erysipelothrix sp.]
MLTLLFMVISSFYIAPEVFADAPTTVTNDDGVSLTKTASRTTGKLNEWRIDLKLDFAPKVIKQDIVLVIDTSGSMASNSRIANAKTAAKLFTSILLDNSRPHDNRIAIVSFASGVYQRQGFTNNRSSLNTSIDSLSASGGTFTQAGVKMARDMLSTSTADNKIIVLLSDGVPTFGYGLTPAGLTKFNTGNFTEIQSGERYSESNITYNSSNSTYSTSNGVSFSGGTYSNPLKLYQASNNREENFIVSDFNYALNNSSDMGGEGSVAQKFAYKVSNTNVRLLNLFKTAIAEAKIAKNAGNTMYTIALDLAGNANAEATLKSMASSTGHYFLASSGNLSTHLENIASQIAFPFTGMSITDPMGTGFSYIANSVTAHKGSLAGLVGSPDNINWTMTDQSFVYNTTTKRYEMHISYLVEANSSVIPLVESSPNGIFDTNGDTKFNYTFNNGLKHTLFPKPKVRPTVVKVVKELQDEDGNVMVFNDASLPRVFNYTLQETGGNHTGGISQANSTSYHILQPVTEKTITETSVTNDDLNRYIRSTVLIKENGNTSTLSNGNFTLEPESGLNTIKMVNKLNANYVPQFTVTKDVVDGNDDGYAEANEKLTYTVSITNTSSGFIRDLFIQDTLSQINTYIDTTNTNLIISRNGTTVLNDLEISDLITGFTTHMAAGDTLVLTFEVDVKEGLTLPSNLVNTVIVSHKDADANIPTGRPIISATKSVVDSNNNGYAEAGESLTYTITVRNTGNVKKTNLAVQDTLVDLLPYIDDITALTLSVNGINRPLTDLVAGFNLDIDAGQTITMIFTVRVKATFNADAVGMLHNLATVGDEEPETEIPTGKPV